MDQNRPLTPQEREWQREKQMPPEADSGTLDGSVQLTPEDMEKLRRAQSNGQSQSVSNLSGANPPAPQVEGATIPAIPMNIPRNNPPQPPARPQTPGPAELDWHREKQFPQGGQVQSPQAAPEAMPTLEALPQVSRQASTPPVVPPTAPEAMPTMEALPRMQRPHPSPPVPPAQPGNMPSTAPALPNQPRQQPYPGPAPVPAPGPPVNPTRPQQTRPQPVPPPANPARPQSQTPPQGQNQPRPYQPLGQSPNAAPGLSPEELQWQREKQAYPGMTPQEIQWQREKQAYPTEQPRPGANLTPQEHQWQQEKQAYPAAGLTPQELEWQREKQNYGGGAAPLTPQERQWQQEKQGRPGAPVPPISAAPNNWNPRPGAVPPVPPVPIPPQYVVRQPERRRGAWWWLLIPLFLLIIAAAVVVFLLLAKPGNSTATTTATSSVASITGTPGVTGGTPTITPGTPGVTGTASGTPNGTPGVTTGGALIPGQLTATAQAGTSPSVATSAAQNEDLFNQGKSAYDSRKWLDAITAWEKVDPNSATYAKTKPLLGTAYYNQANDLALKNTTPDSLSQAIGFYNKASAIAPDNADYRTAAENASFYQSGSKAVGSKDWDTAVNLLSQLYSRNPDFRDTVQLYYNSLEGQGDAQAQSGNLIAAKDSYSTALGLTFKSNPPDTTALKAKLADIDAKLNPTPTASPTATAAPTASPTAVPTPTKKPVPTPTPAPTKKPTPTNTPVPLAPCAKGGSGSNFFAFRTGQPSVPNVPDQGRSGVRGVVLSKSGAPIAGASVRISTNGHSFTSVTDGGGNYFREGLGRGVWNISVVAAPGRTICFGATGTVNLSGQSGFYGSVDFTESVP